MEILTSLEISSSWVLGGEFKTLHKYLEFPKDVTGSAHVVRTYTGFYKGTRISTIAIAGGGVYAEWIMAMAYKRRIKSLIGVGLCGALAHQLDIGDIVIPTAAVRDENTSDHYVDERYPSVADFHLIQLANATFKEIAPEIKVHKGIIITTSSTFTESPEWGENWSSKNVIAVECEISVIYTLASLIDIPAVNILVVSDHVTKSKSREQDKLSAKWMSKAFDSALKVAYETTVKIAALMKEKDSQNSVQPANARNKQKTEKSSLKDPLDW